MRTRISLQLMKVINRKNFRSLSFNLNCFFQFFSVVGTCLFAYGRRVGELCRRDTDCESGLVCAEAEPGTMTRVCRPPVHQEKQYSELCNMSNECDISRGLCCQLQRRHRQAPRKVWLENMITLQHFWACFFIGNWVSLKSLCGFAIFDGFSTMVVDAQYLLYRHTVGVGLAAAVTDRPERDASSTSKFPEGNGVNRSLIASSPYKQRKLLYCFWVIATFWQQISVQL